jgi:hypothetical protein
MRGFTCRAKQRHRPGLEAMASAGGKHGFESLKEVSLLVALDFLRASEVLSQPFRPDFEHAGGHAWHIPDFLAVIGGGMWLLDVRPMELIKEEDALKFAAAREVAVACGWRYSVVAGWRPHVWSVLDHLSSRRRPAGLALAHGAQANMPMAADRPGCRTATRSGDGKTPIHSLGEVMAVAVLAVD